MPTRADLRLTLRLSAADVEHLLVPDLSPEKKQVIDGAGLWIAAILKQDPEQVAARLAIVQSNSFTILNEELKLPAVGLCALAAFVNHSCAPNVVPLWEGPVLSLRALRTLSPNEEITLPYTDTYASTEQRRQRLADEYFFTCHCARCEGPELLLNVKDAALAATARALTKIDVDTLVQASKLWDKAVDHLNVERVDCLRFLEKEAIQNHRWNEALVALRALTEPYERIFPVGWPLLTLHYLTLFRIELLVGDPRNVMSLLPAASASLKISHGDSHILARALAQSVDNAKRDIVWIQADPETYARQRKMDQLAYSS